ncbi:MAG: DNA repair protein RecO [Gammaproteobacteria bacterium]
MRVDPHPAFVLHRRAYRETSLLVEALSSLHGRVGLVARGARRARSPWRTAFEPFRPVLVAWGGRGDLGTVSSAEPQADLIVLGATALAAGFYLNELVMRLTQRHDPHPELFQRYAIAVAALASGQEVDIVLRLFEKSLLEAIGYAMTLDREAATGEAVVAEERYFYQADVGPLSLRPTAAPCMPLAGTTLLDLARERFDSTRSRREARLLLRFLLRPHLGERPIASRALLPRGDDVMADRG